MTMVPLALGKSRADLTPVLSVLMKAATDSELPLMTGIFKKSNLLPGGSAFP